MGNESLNMGIINSHKFPQYVDNLSLYFILAKIADREAATKKRLVSWTLPGLKFTDRKDLNILFF
jgi:hypothetical protein